MPLAHLPAHRLTALLALALLSGCLRDHPQRDGDYALRATSITRDACGLVAADGSLGTLTLARHGNDVHGGMSLHGIALQGRYLSGLEAFLIAGDAASVETEVDGVACTVPLVQATLRAETTLDGEREGEAFIGTLTVAYRAPLEAACACELVAEIEGTLQEAAP